MTKNETKHFRDRNLSFDIAKGIAIFLMVIGHTSLPEFAQKWIFSFHMPLFFLISGVFFNPVKNHTIHKFVIKKIKTLLIPYFLFLLISEVTKATCNIENGPIWFLPVLFATEITFYSILRVSSFFNSPKNISILLTSLIAVTSYIMSAYDISLPLKMEDVGHALIYYAFGYYCSNWIKNISLQLWKTTLLMIIFFVAIQFIPRLDICPNYWSFPPLSQFLAIIGTILTILGARAISRWNTKNPFVVFFDWAGKNSIIPLGFSAPIIIIFNTVANHFILIENAPFLSIGKHLILWVIMYYLSLLLLKYAPWAMGKYKQ